MWTKKQAQIFDLKKNGKFVVEACPGSGKTCSIVKRINNHIKEYENKKPLAILSFTNVAINEIKTKYIKKYKKEIAYPHFIGTFDSFINNYILLPFGKDLLKLKDNPKLFEAPHSPFIPQNYIEKKSIQLTYNINGKLYNENNKLETTASYIKKKKELNKKGYFTQSDANYFSMKILMENPIISELISLKFPYLIIDEAQDHSEIQMQIVDLLIKNNLNNVILIGDYEQSIYEWNNAKPQLFKNKYQIWEKNSITLNESFRCSENICNYLSKLSSMSIISKNRFSNYPVEITNYKANNYNNLINKFITDCENKKILINTENVAILTRSEIDFLNLNKKININDIWKSNNYHKQSYTKEIITGKWLLHNNNYFDAFKKFENAYFMINANKNYKVNLEKSKRKNGFIKHRIKILKFMNHFPEITDENQLIDKWINEVNNLTDYDLNPIKISYKNEKLNELLTWKLLFEKKENDTYYYGTVHSVKGKTYDAVLLIVKNKDGNNKKYTKLLKEYVNLDYEELRIIYVAMSRARKYLQIAVPSKDKLAWENFFKSEQVSLFDF